jgi:hypothetical protein
MVVFSEQDPPRGVVWHIRYNVWRVVVRKMDRSVNPPRQRDFYRAFSDFETAIRVRDYVSRILHGSNAKLHTDGKLPPSVTRVDIIRWLIAGRVIDPDEVPKFMGRVKSLDTHSSCG